MLDKYLEVYNKGSHCASTSLMNMCNYYDMGISENMCFGLGQALGFSFYKNEIMNTYSFSGRSRDIVRNFCETVGIEVEMGHSMTNNELWEKLEYHIIENKSPVLVKLDIDSTEYLTRFFHLTEKIEQSEHMAVIIGIEDDKALVSEYYQKEPITVSKQELFVGMNKKFEEKSISNLYYVFRNIPKHIDLDICLKIALIGNKHSMKFGFGSNLGLPGLKKFSHDIKIMYENMEKEKFAVIMKMADISFEKIGTGGGNFRRIYARFLKEASKTTGNTKLEKISEVYSELAMMWKRFAKLAERLSVEKFSGDVIFNALYQLNGEIYNKEKSAIELWDSYF